MKAAPTSSAPNGAPHDDSPYLNIDQAATYLGVSRRTLQRAVRDGRIKHVRNPLNGRLQFTTNDLEAVLRSGGQ